jgi:hypothetical protein
MAAMGPLLNSVEPIETEPIKSSVFVKQNIERSVLRVALVVPCGY